MLAILTLDVNGIDQGEVSVYLEDGDALVPIAALERAGVPLAGIQMEERAGTLWTRLSSSPFAWHVDERALRISIELAPSELPGQTVRVHAFGAPEGIEYRHDTSAFFNYGVRLLDFQRVDGSAELGANYRDLRAYTAVTVPWGSLPVRGVSNLTWDDRTHLRRVVLGDAFATGGALGGAAWLGGAQLSRTLALDPYFVSGGTLDRSTTVIAPSTLEVYVNGQLAHRQQVAPGPLDVTDIPATVGAGDTRIVLRDALGHEQVLTASYYQPTDLLAPGEQEYTYTAGFQREHVGTESWAYDTPAALGLHRVGITPGLTASGRLELALDRASGGVGSVFGTGLGQLELTIGGSASDAAFGAAGAAAWSYRGRRVGASAWARGMSNRYVTLGLDADHDRSLAESGVSIGVPITQRASVSASYAVGIARDTGASQRVSLSGGVQLPLRLQLSGYGSWARRAEEDSFNAYLGLTRAFGKRVTATVRAEAGSDGGNGYAEVQQSLPTNAGIGYRVGGRVGMAPEAFADLRGQASFGRADAAVDWQPGAFTGQLGVAGGLVAIGGRVFASRPVDASYALVRVPGVAGVQASLNNNPVGRTDRRGDLIVNGLLPNYGNRLEIQDLDVPIDRSIAAVERVIAPPVRGGAVVEFPVRQSRLVRGRLALADGDPAFGEMQVGAMSASYTSPIGTGGEFEFDSLPAGRWTAAVRYPGGRCAALIDVPDSPTSLIDIGAVACVTTEAP